MAADSAGTYTASNAVLTVTPKTVSGAPAVPVADTVQGKLLSNANPLFTQKTLWVRVGAAGSNSSLTTPVVGHMVLTTLRLSAFINDKFF